jgi:hypothetical protein
LKEKWAMKKLILTAAAGAAALALSACNSSEPAADETVVETETPAADELAVPTDAATDAAAADATATDAAADAAASPAATESPSM